MNWSEFIEMGGYGFYVWSAWGITVVFLLLMVTVPLRKNVVLKREIARQYQRERWKYRDPRR